MDPRYSEFISNHPMLFLALGVVTYLLIKEFTEAALSKFKSLTPTNAVAKMNQSDMLIIDVREPVEFAGGHIENAQNTPVNKLKEQLSTLEKYKSKDILVVCQSGTRSSSACNLLVKAGFEKIFNLDGGMQSWEDYKFPIVKSGKKNK